MLHPQVIKRLVLISIIFLAFLYLFQSNSEKVTSRVYYYFNPKQSIQCYRVKTTNIADILFVHPRRGQSIFFHETSCNSHLNGKITINARQACAVESAAKLNPNFEVYLLYASPGIFHFEEKSESDRFLEALLTYKNVRIHHVDYERYTRRTPVEDLYKNGKLEGSEYAQSHASDLLRYLTLWRYGGIYLDLDVIVTKSLEKLPLNYAGQESETNVAAGVLSFSPSGSGHLLAQRCLEDLRDHFRGNDWGYNGPGVITRLLGRTCRASRAQDMLGKNCGGFKVYPSNAFYPVQWWNWTMYFDESSTEKVLNLSRNSYAIHVWNKHSAHQKIPIKANVPYAIFARDFCPKVFAECEEFF